MKRRASNAGVTLVEVLIAVTLLSLLTLGMLMAMRIGLISLAKTDDKLMSNRRVEGAQRILEQELEGLIPVGLATCGKTVFPSPSPLILFQAEERTMRLVSAFSLQQAWRGQPQVLELFIVPADDGRGVRLVVNETPYTPTAAGNQCLGFGPDPNSGLLAAHFAPPEASTHSFVLADRLAYCRFSYLVQGARGGVTLAQPTWQTSASSAAWPVAIRVDMAPLEPNPSQLQPIAVTAPIYIHRSPQIEYGDY